MPYEIIVDIEGSHHTIEILNGPVKTIYSVVRTYHHTPFKLTYQGCIIEGTTSNYDKKILQVVPLVSPQLSRYKRSSLWNLCSITGQCLAVGKPIDSLNSFFDHASFRYAKSYQEVSSGQNGTISSYTYNREGYLSYAILKKAHGITSDSLVYEYLVGVQFINKMIRKYPCFIYTYGLYDNLQLQKEVNFEKACTQSGKMSILIQSIHHGVTLETYLNDRYFLEYELLPVLYIIYHTLSELSKVYTHYDLHGENIILFELTTPIEYVYPNVTFRSKYIPKLIDYGRCFFSDKVSSSDVYKSVCKSCEKCGYDSGFSLLDPESFMEISSQRKNESHDLRLLDMIKNKYTLDQIYPPALLIPLLEKVVYGEGLEGDDKIYGTRENLTVNDRHIYNVTGARIALETCMQKFRSPHQVIGGKMKISPGQNIIYQSIEG